MRGSGEGMSRLGKYSFGRLSAGEATQPPSDVDPAPGRAMLKWLVLGCAVLAASFVAGLAATTLSLRECVLLAVVAILAVTVALLLQRHQWFHRTLAAERRHLRTAVDNIPQGLVLYDASARIVACDQPY